MCQVRFVDHLAIELNRTCTSRLGKRVNDALGMLQFFWCGLKALVDDGNLVGVNRQFTAEALSSGALNICLQALGIAKVNV